MKIRHAGKARNSKKYPKWLPAMLRDEARYLDHLAHWMPIAHEITHDLSIWVCTFNNNFLFLWFDITNYFHGQITSSFKSGAKQAAMSNPIEYFVKIIRNCNNQGADRFLYYMFLYLSLQQHMRDQPMKE